MFEQKLTQLMDRLALVEGELSHPDVLKNQKRFKELTQEHSYLTEVKSSKDSLEKFEKELKEASEMLDMESDPEFSTVLKAEINELELQKIALITKIENLLVPPDPHDHSNTLIEIRAGTGGEEAALFVADCARMYKLFAEKMHWKWEVLNFTDSDMGGFKDVTMVLSGQNVHRFMQYEYGTHRVQRIPDTETQGRVHTSAITIAILLEPGENEDIVIDEARDLRIDTMRSSGAGGQHVNKTDSAVRITHLPTGIAIVCQEERSQHKNKDKAMRILRARLLELREEKQRAELSSERKEQVGSGDRSERIRTYNFSQNRVTDHRMNFTSHNLDKVMEGDLEDITAELVKFYYQRKFS